MATRRRGGDRKDSNPRKFCCEHGIFFKVSPYQGKNGRCVKDRLSPQALGSLLWGPVCFSPSLFLLPSLLVFLYDFSSFSLLSPVLFGTLLRQLQSPIGSYRPLLTPLSAISVRFPHSSEPDPSRFSIRPPLFVEPVRMAAFTVFPAA